MAYKSGPQGNSKGNPRGNPRGNPLGGASKSPSPRTGARREAIRILAGDEKTNYLPPDWNSVSNEHRAFARELFGGVSRWRSRLDWTLAPLLSKPLEKLDAPVRAALRAALYEKIELQTPVHALANEYAGLMRDFKVGSASGFVNAIMRRLSTIWRPAPGELAHRFAIEFAHPQWMVERYLGRFGEHDTEKLLRANQQHAPLILRANTLKISRENLLDRLTEANFHARASEISPDGIVLDDASAPTALPGWNEGLFTVQDEAAQMVALLAVPAGAISDDFLVVDAAAAPGGKTTHLAQLLGGRGKILACDSAPSRLPLIEENARRLGISNIATRAGDFRALAEELKNSADLVLLDAPCLGSGTFRRRPDAKWRKTPATLAELVALQSELLDAAAQVVKPGGTLVYSTCSLESEENELQLANFKQRYPQWSVLSPSSALGMARWGEYLALTPHNHGCDGMFAAHVQKPS